MTTPAAPQPSQPVQVQIATLDELSRGRFSNNLLVGHNQEEFILDWILTAPNGMHLVSRIIVTPGHMKRIVAGVAENIHRYEQMFGPIRTQEGSDQRFHGTA